MNRVYKYGALPPELGGVLRSQITLAREYYNALIEAENDRRKAVWNSDTVPPPPHEHKQEKPCDECLAHWKAIRDKYRATPFVDIKPYRAKASEGGLYWGTYLMVEESFNAAVKKTSCLLPVKFKSWKSGGIMGVQIQRGKLQDSQFKISRAEDPRTGRRAGQRHTIKFRIGTENNHEITWTDSIKFEMHRPLDGRPTWAKASVQYRGTREVWNVIITCADVPDRRPRAIDGIVAIDVGWRVMQNNSIRIAYAHGSDNVDKQLILSPRWRERTERADRIRAERDRRFNELQTEDKRFASCKSPQGVVRFAFKNDINDPLITEWIKRERHLEQYEDGCRRKAVAARKDTIRVWLSKLTPRYKTVVIKNSSHKEMKDRKKAKAAGMSQPARHNGHLCAPGEVIEEICRAFGRDECVAVVNAEYTTATCHVCKNPLSVNGELMLCCERCNAYYDRDIVSTRNMMNLYLTGNHEKPTARKTTPRFAKRHANFSERHECQLNDL
jgi:transposase